MNINKAEQTIRELENRGLGDTDAVAWLREQITSERAARAEVGIFTDQCGYECRRGCDH